MLLAHFKERRYYLWIALLAFIVRAIWAIVVPVMPVSDSAAYDTFAQNLANCQNYGWDCTTPSAYWPVGTSFIYALFYRLFGHTYTPIVVFNLVVGVLTVLLSMHLAERWFGRRIAALTGILLALWCSQIQFTTVLASEQIFTALVLAALVIWSRERTNLWLRAVMVGVVLAATSYVRPIAFLLPALLMFLRYVSTRKVRENITAALIMFSVIALLVAPWSIRNTQAFGQFVTISTNGGANLWMGNNPASTGGYMELPSEVDGMNEAVRDKYLKSIAVAHIKEQPILFALRTAQRIVDTHSRESIGVVWNEPALVSRFGNRILTPLKILNQLYWIPMLGLGLVGIVLLIVKTGWFAAITHPTVLLWGYFTAIHAIIVAQDRYHFPSIPMIAILSASTLVFVLDMKFKKRDPAHVAAGQKKKQAMV